MKTLETNQNAPKHSTQIISLWVGSSLIILGLCGLMFPGFAGLHLSLLYSLIVCLAGITLVVTGYKNNEQYAFLSCSLFGFFFGLHSVAGWFLGIKGMPRLGYDQVDAKWLSIIPRVHELATTDHILNGVLCLVLFGGAIDWWRRHKDKNERVNMFKDLKQRMKTKIPSKRLESHP